MTSPRVIIVGAGAAGLAAGTKLFENGIENIIWLEAEDRIGGRVYTSEFGNNVVDIGAQWCHGEVGNVVYKLANPLGLLQSSKHNFTDPDRAAEFFTSSGESLLPCRSEISRITSTLFELTHDDEHMAEAEGSLGEYMTKKFEEKKKTDLKDIDNRICDYVFEWFHKVENSLEASDSWFQTSAKGLTNYKECEGDLLLNWKEKGFTTILNILLKKIPDISKALPIDQKILLNKEVSKINWDNKQNGGVEVFCKDNSCYKGDHVIVTVSLGVLKEKAHKIFNPELPLRKMNAINGLSIGTVNKLIFEYPYRWWPENHRGFSLVWNQEDKDQLCKKFGGSKEDNSWLLDVFGFYPIDHQPNVLLGWVIGAAARKMEQLPEDEVKQKLVQLIDMFVDKKFNVPQPVRFLRSMWYTNKHFRGSYTFRSLTTEQLGTSATDLGYPLKNNDGKDILHFSGEATHDHYFSTVHGAIESGWREANRILNYYRSPCNRRQNDPSCSKI